MKLLRFKSMRMVVTDRWTLYNVPPIHIIVD